MGAVAIKLYEIMGIAIHVSGRVFPLAVIAPVGTRESWHGVVLQASVIVPASASGRRTEVRLTQLPAKAGVPSAGRNDDQGRSANKFMRG